MVSWINVPIITDPHELTEWGDYKGWRYRSLGVVKRMGEGLLRRYPFYEIALRPLHRDQFIRENPWCKQKWQLLYRVRRLE